MKKLLMAIMILAIGSYAWAGGQLLLNGVSATGAGDGQLIGTTEKHTVSVYYTDANASISALVVAFQASNDPASVTDANAHWYTVASHTFTASELTAKQAMFHIVNAPVERVRLNVTTATGIGAGVDAVYARYTAGR